MAEAAAAPEARAARPLPPAGPRPRAARHSDAAGPLLLFATLYVGVFCVLPLARLGLEAVRAAEAGLLGEVLAARATRRALWNTLEAGLASTLVALLVGGGAALLTGLTDLRGRRLATFLLLVPLLIPSQIAAMAWLQLLSPASPLLELAGMAPAPGARNPLYSREGVILLLGLEHATMPFLAVRAGLASIPPELLEAARIAGARPLRLVPGIVLPLLRPAFLAGGALAFVAALGNFGIPALLGIPGRYPLLTALIYQRLSGFGPKVLGEVAVLAMLLALVAALGLLLQGLALRRAPPLSGRGGGPEPLALGRARLPVELAFWGGLLPITILPLLALVASALVPSVGVPLRADTVTLAQFGLILAGHGAIPRAFANSLLLAGLAAVATVAASLPLAWLVRQGRSRLARALDLAADAPWALPGIVLAIAVILVHLQPLPLLGRSLYASFGILLVAYAGRFLALALRPVAAGVAQLDPALDEAGRNLGAGLLRRLVDLHLPLTLPAAAAGGLLVVMTALNELTVSALLWSSGNETLGVVVFMLYDEGNTGGAAAVATVATAAVLAIAGLASLLARLAGLPRGVLPWQG